MTLDPQKTTVAADIGGTHMRAALITSDGEIIHREVIPTPHHDRVPSELVDLIIEVTKSLALGPEEIPHIVMGLPGQMNYLTGTVVWAPNLPQSWHADLSEAALGAMIGYPVMLANDADIAAVGEAYLGAGRGYDDVAYITISTGVGGGVVSKGKLVRANQSLAELGRTIVDADEWRARRAGTLEELASGTGLSRMAEQQGLGSISGEEVNARARRGEEVASRIWDRAVGAAAAGISNVINCFAPEIVVLGGGLGLQDDFASSVAAVLQAHASPHLPAVPIVSAALGDSAGLVGACRWLAATQP